MSTTIVPSLGNAPLVQQQGVGTSPGYTAQDLRRLGMAGLQEGVFGAQSYEVTQRAAGANMSVDIAASTSDALGSGLAAVVQGDAVSLQGLYGVPAHSAVINEAISAAHATLPRLDQVVLEVLDNFADASGSNLVRTRVVNGTATAGATLANRTGAAALPASALLLADVLVAAAASSITNAAIGDRRTYALYSGGKAIIATAETRTSSSYGLLATPDRVSSVVVPADALVVVTYSALWKASGAATMAAALFIGANQLQLADPANDTWSVQNAILTESSQFNYRSLGTWLGGLTSAPEGTHSVDTPAMATTGTALSVTATLGGQCVVEGLAAGTYDFSVQFLTSAGTMTVKNRKLRVRVLPF